MSKVSLWLPVAFIRLPFIRWGVCLAGLFFSNASGALSLENLLSQALQSYPTILAQRQSREAADTDKTASMLRFLPSPAISTQRNQVTYDGQASRGQPAVNYSISQPLWMGGGLLAGYNKADARLNAADYGILEARLDVSRRLITAYAEWVRAYLKILSLEESVHLHERFVATITRRSESGVAPESDRDLAQSRLMQAMAELNTQMSVEKSSLTALSQLIGEPITRLELEKEIAKPYKVPARDEVIEIAMVTNPTVHRLSYEADAADEEAKEVRARALPQVSFRAERQENNAIIPGAPSYDAYGLVVNFAPDGGFASVATASAAFSRAEAARTQVETSKRDLLDRLNADFNEYEFSRLRQENLKNSVDLSGEISASYDRQYLVGRKSWLDLMNMVRERAQNRVQLADAVGGAIGASHRLRVYVEGTNASEVDPIPYGSDCDEGDDDCYPIVPPPRPSVEKNKSETVHAPTEGVDPKRSQDDSSDPVQEMLSSLKIKGLDSPRASFAAEVDENASQATCGKQLGCASKDARESPPLSKSSDTPTQSGGEALNGQAAQRTLQDSRTTDSPPPETTSVNGSLKPPIANMPNHAEKKGTFYPAPKQPSAPAAAVRLRGSSRPPNPPQLESLPLLPSAEGRS